MKPCSSILSICFLALCSSCGLILDKGRWTGGHAYLHRQFGRALRTTAGGRRRINTTEIEHDAVERFEEQSEAATRAWLRTVAKRSYLDHLRRNRRAPDVNLDQVDAVWQRFEGDDGGTG